MASAKPKKKNPRLASGRKRVRQNTKLNAANTSLRSKYRTAVKNVEKAVAAKDLAKAKDAFALMQSVVDSAIENFLAHFYASNFVNRLFLQRSRGIDGGRIDEADR